jgi:hypothetical protein
MSVGAWNPSISSAEVKRASASHFDLKADQTTGGVYLMSKEHTDPLQAKIREIRRFFDRNTVKISSKEVVIDPDTGKRHEEDVRAQVIPSQNYWRVSEFTQRVIPEFDALRKEFLDNLHDKAETCPYTGNITVKKGYITRSKENLGKLGEILDAKGMKAWDASVEEWAEKIYFKFTSFPVADPTSLGNLKGMTEDMRRAMETETRAKYNLIDKAVTRELNTRFAKVLQDFIAKMKTFKEGSRMHDSIIENITDLVQILPDMVVNADPTLAKLAEEASLLGNWDTDLLKESEVARNAASDTAKSILDKLQF